MSGHAVRVNAVSSIISQGEVFPTFDYQDSPTSNVWGQNVFSFHEMAERLPKAVYKSLKHTIETGGQRDPGVADATRTRI